LKTKEKPLDYGLRAADLRSDSSDPK
jgi:hypothetical protein